MAQVLHLVQNPGYGFLRPLKIKSTFKMKGESGRHLTTNPPFGYVKDEQDKDRWLIDEEAAKTVRYIFKLYSTLSKIPDTVFCAHWKGRSGSSSPRCWALYAVGVSTRSSSPSMTMWTQQYRPSLT